MARKHLTFLKRYILPFQSSLKRKDVPFQKGFALTEVILSIVVGSLIITALAALYPVYLKHFDQGLSFNQVRSKLANGIETLGQDLANAQAVYVDSSQCYELCYINSAGNRVYYYWSGSDLLQKSEATSTAPSCSSGKPFLKSMTTASTAFSLLGNLTTIKLASNGTNNTSFMIQSSVFANKKEREIIFYDGFECITSSSQGWVLTATDKTTLSVESKTNLSGRYVLDARATGNSGGETATAVIPIDLSRITSPMLTFNYMGDTNMSSGESFSVDFYDGSWHQVYLDSIARNAAVALTGAVDLSSYTINASNQIRFNLTLKTNGHDWLVDEISIFSK
ncbi:MAG: hypothetical protein HY537_12555 [Deltaproteobacteria bacterium]|nr:hypothetical protein [Deltaproteobacteria bacterium]